MGSFAIYAHRAIVIPHSKIKKKQRTRKEQNDRVHEYLCEGLYVQGKEQTQNYSLPQFRSRIIALHPA